VIPGSIPEGSAIVFSAEHVAALFSADAPVSPGTEAHTTVEHLANSCGCSFIWQKQAATGTFTKHEFVSGLCPVPLQKGLDGGRNEPFAGALVVAGGARTSYTLPVAVPAGAFGAIVGGAVVWTLAVPGLDPTTRNVESQIVLHQSKPTIVSADQPAIGDSIGHDESTLPQPSLGAVGAPRVCGSHEHPLCLQTFLSFCQTR
jgi:hypothetical protein